MNVGCATIVTGTDEPLTFTSEPEGATVKVGGKLVGKTPLTVAIKKDRHVAVSFHKNEYKTHITHLHTKKNPWMWGNLIFLNLPSFTDLATGADIEYEKKHYFVTLQPEKAFHTSVNRQRQVKELVVSFSDDIRLELTTNGGEIVDALIASLGLNDSDKESAVRLLNQLSLQNKNDLDFAKAVIKAYDVRQ